MASELIETGIFEKSNEKIERARTDTGKLRHDLSERVKELRLLHDATHILQQDWEDASALLHRLAAVIPLAFQYPEIAAARIRLGSVEAKTHSFRESPFALRADFITAGGQSGSIEVIYAKQTYSEDEELFLPEERTLINTLVDMLRTAYDRQMAETALRESEERYRTLVKASSLIVWSTNAEGNHHNLPGWVELTGQTEEEAIGGGWLKVVHPDDREKAAREWEQGKKTQSTFEFEYRVRAKDGSYRYVVSRAVPIIRNGRVCEWIGAIYDVTERKIAEQIVRQERDFSEAILNSLPGIFYLYDDNYKFHRWNKAFEIVSGYTGIEIESMHPLDFFTEAERKRVDARIDDVFALGKSDVEADFVSKDGHKTPYYFTGVNARIEGKNSLIGVGIDITERKRAEDAQRKIRQQYKSLVESIDGIVWELDTREFKFTFVSKQAEKILGYPVAQWLNEQGFWVNHIHPDDSNWAVAYCMDATEKKADHQFEYRMVAADGRVVWLRDIVTVHIREDNSVWLRGIMVDITERKRAEDERWASEVRYRTLFEYAPDGILIADSESYYLDANASICRMLGYTRDELIGLHASDIVESSEIEYIGQALSIIKSHHDYYREWLLRRKDGSVFPAEVIATMMPDGNLMGMVRDITERKQAEEKIKLSQSQLAEAQRLAHVGSWNIDLKTNVLTWSEQLYYIFGLTPQEFNPTREGFLKMVHPEDRDLVIARIEKSYNNPEQFNYYYRIIRADGAVRIIYSKGNVAYDEEGNPVRSFGTMQDVTERKLAEEKLKNSNNKLRALSARLQSVREEESIHIAREIHDDLGGALTGLKMDISWLGKRLPDSISEELRQKLKSMSELIDETVQKVRNISTELRPSVLDDLGLAAAIEWQTREFQKRTEIECKINSLQENITLSMQVSTAVFRIFQEILTNVARHASATQVEISLHEREGDLVLIVSDNGRGIKETDMFDTKSLGLLGMHERAIVFGGQIEINGIEGKGTTVTVSIPRE